GEGLGQEGIRLVGPSRCAEAARGRREDLARDLSVVARLTEARECPLSLRERLVPPAALEQDPPTRGARPAGLIARLRVVAAQKVRRGRERAVEVSAPVAVVDALRVEPGDAHREAIALAHLARLLVTRGRLVEAAHLPEEVGKVVELGPDAAHLSAAPGTGKHFLQVGDSACVAG